MIHFILLSLVMFISSCQTLPQLYQTAEDIANDEAIQVMISREALQKQTDLNIKIEVKNSTNN